MHSLNDDRSMSDQTKGLLEYNPSGKPLDDPIRRYNYVIRSYNNLEITQGINLEYIKESNIYRSFWKIINRPCLFFVVFLLILIPVVGILPYLWIFFGIMLYLSGMTVITRNRRRMPDPFSKLVFCPELCQEEQIFNKYFKMRAQDLDSLSLNEEIIKTLKENQEEGQVSFMVYNGQFWDFYHGYDKLKMRHVCIFVVSTLFLVAQGVLVWFISLKII